METSLSVTFNLGDGGDDAISLSAELNEEKNEGKTEFPFDSGVCWINVFGSAVQGPTAAAPRADSSFGSISGGQIIMTEKETTFTIEHRAWFERDKLSPPFGVELISASFLGKGELGSLQPGFFYPTDDPEEDPVAGYHNSAGPLFGELTVKYRVMARLYKITNVPKPDSYNDAEDPGLSVIAFFQQYGSQAATTATFKNAEGPRLTKIKVVNHCSGDPVPNAAVTLGGGLTGGVTDADGYIDLGLVSPGTYDIESIVASGYDSIHTDTLDNETITVPSESEETPSE